MNILLVHGDMTAKGGAEVYAQGIAACLLAMGHRVGWLDIHGHLPPGGSCHAALRAKLLVGIAKLSRLHLLKYAVVCRSIPEVIKPYSHVILTYGEGPKTGRPTLRVLHAPSLFSGRADLFKYLGNANPNAIQLLARYVYQFCCRGLARPIINDGGATHTIANSQWTKQQFQQAFDCPVNTVNYPKVVPVTGANIPKKTLSFVVLGRIVRGKRLEQAVSIITQLRNRGHLATLQIIGRAQGRYAQRFFRTHQQLPYVSFIPDASASQIQRALLAAEFGLHCYQFEHFGISVAEMITAGCLPLVYDGGGVCELVPDPALRFSSTSDAVTKIIALNALSKNQRAKRQADLRETKALNGAIQFDRGMKHVLTEFLYHENANAKLAV